MRYPPTEVGNDVVDEHEEGGTGGVTDLQLEDACDELCAVPEARRGADREQIAQGSHCEGQPPEEVICSVKLFPIHVFLIYAPPGRVGLYTP